MDTVERAAATGAPVYDGFISYSHAADDLLAPRLQSALQRFAKPWWKRRALRVFRDESSLSANPHLWSSITDALNKSAWFVLLLSPDAAASPWVNQEIDYWVQRKETNRIIPVVTAGEFGWEGDVTGDAAPETLRGALSEEPRWVDLRWAQGEEQLDLQDPRFADAVADIASAMRGLPKDELAGEEVRQHRRTVRTAWAAGAALLGLAVVAVWASVLSARNAEEAQRQAQIAEQNEAKAQANADEADAQRSEAERQAGLAEENADDAERSALEAKAGELVASAIAAMERDPELAILLLLESARTSPSGLVPEARIALREVVEENRLLHRVSVADGGTVEVDFVPGGSDVVVAAGGDVSRRTVDGAVVWSTDLDASVVEVSPDGSLVAVGENESVSAVVLDAATGDVLESLPGFACPFGGIDSEVKDAFTPDGRYLLVYGGPADCPGTEGPLWVALFSTDTWEEELRFEDVSMTFSDDMSLVAMHQFEEKVAIRSFPDLELEREIETGGWDGLLSPDGTRYVVMVENETGFRPTLWDVEEGVLIDRLDAFDSFSIDAAFFPDSSRVMAFGTDSTFVWSTADGRVSWTIPTANGRGSISSDGSLVAVGSQRGEYTVWRASERTEGTSVDPDPDVDGVVWVNPNSLLEGDPTALLAFEFVDPEQSPAIRVVTLDAASGEEVGRSPALEVITVGRFDDGRIFVPFLVDSPLGPAYVWDPAGGEVEVFGGCETTDDLFSAAAAAGAFVTCDGHHVLGQFFVEALDGESFAIGAFGPPEVSAWPVEIWDATTGTLDRTIELRLEHGWVDYVPGGQVLGDGWILLLDGTGGATDNAYAAFDSDSGARLATLEVNGGWRGPAEVGADGSTVFLSSNDGEIFEYELGTWEPIRHWRAHRSRGRGLGLSPDGSLLASTGEDGFTTIWDLSAATLVDRIPGRFPSDAMWVDDDTLGIIERSGEWRVVPLDESSLLAAAGGQLTRPFTAAECREYGIDPCPTLKELGEG